MSDKKSNVAVFPSGSNDPNALLEAARNADLENVVIIGWEKGTGELHIGTSHGNLIEGYHTTMVGAQIMLNMTLAPVT